VISQVDGKAVDSLAAAVNRIDGLSPGQQVLIVVDRGSALAAGTLVLPARPGSP
jgi:S1-C subfamily serine protease